MLSGPKPRRQGRAPLAESTAAKRSFEFRSISRGELLLLTQQHIQQGPMDLDFAVVFDETQLPKLVHEEIDVGSAGADHLRERLLIDLGHDPPRAVFLA